MSDTVQTAKHARLMQMLGEAEKKLNQNLRTIGRLKSEKCNLQQQLADLSSDDQYQNNALLHNLSKYPILKQYLDILHSNIQKQKNGRRFSDMDMYFALLSNMGPHYYNILEQTLLFPTYRTALRYKEQLESYYMITEHIFNGDIDNISYILGLCLQDYNHEKLIMMVDAAYVTPQVKVKDDGIVTGLLDLNNVSVNTAQEFIHDEDSFTKFIKFYSNQIIKAEFTVMIGCVDPRYKPFPICVISSTSGTATEEIVTKIESILSVLKEKGFIINGIATDGDGSYLIYSKLLLDYIYTNIFEVLQMNVLELSNIPHAVWHFSDPFHLAKRDRYRKVSLKLFRCSPLSNVPYTSVNYLRALGIPDYILTPDKSKKMEDSLPLKMFNYKILNKILRTEDAGLFIAMLPTTLLLEAIHSKTLRRSQRIDGLLFGACIILIYNLTTEYAINTQTDYYLENRNTYLREICFTRDWCCEYISVTLGIAILLASEKQLHLGVCGTHFLEHYFGSIRRISRGDNTHNRFMKSMKNVLLERILTYTLCLNPNISEGRKDSGVIIDGDFEFECRPIISYFAEAKRLLNNIIAFPDDLFDSDLCNITDRMELNEVMSWIFQENEEKRSSISTKSSGIIATGGFSNVRIWKAKNQMNDLVNDDL